MMNRYSSKLRRKKRVMFKAYKKYYFKNDNGLRITPKEDKLAEYAFGRIMDQLYKEYCKIPWEEVSEGIMVNKS